jgi:REP element-mobilizing transposase RayT
MIDDELELVLRNLIRDKILEHNCNLLAVSAMPDHIHLLVSLHPSVDISTLVGEIKGYSSYVIGIKIRPNSGFRWQTGYGAMSVSKSDLHRLTKYINCQKEHHSSNELIETWEF